MSCAILAYGNLSRHEWKYSNGRNALLAVVGLQISGGSVFEYY